MPARLVDMSRDLHSRLKQFFETPLDASATPLEIGLAVLDDVERHVEPMGRGRRAFPYTALTVHVIADEASRLRIEAALQTLDQRVRERLQELNCDPPRALIVTIAWLDERPAGWNSGQIFAVDYGRAALAAIAAPAAPVAPSAEAASAMMPDVVVSVLKGAATDATYRFREPVISIGRSEDPTDALGRIRRNRVAFLDVVDGVTETVGRAHARLRFDQATRDYRLFDDGSSNGTAILRGGETIAVPPRDPRGVRVQSGDEILVGRAVIQIELGTGSRTGDPGPGR
ncbi:MAG: FHA domain-containing protein [Vicinamibacterales bacterium]